MIGDFAFAIWDEPRRKLFCARDHFGVKPFFYAKTKRCFAVSNTLNCLRKHPAISAEIDDLWIADFLLFERSQDPTATAFVDIRRLPPAHYLVWSTDGLRTERYWEIPRIMQVHRRPDGDYVERFRELFDAAVSDRLRADRVGVDMSGGLDSSSIAAVASCLLAERSKSAELHAFTIVYDRIFADEERRYASAVADKLGILIHYCVADDFGLFARDERPGCAVPSPAITRVRRLIFKIWKRRLGTVALC